MNANQINYYPNQVFDEYGLCMCGDCLSCRPDLFPIKPNQCVVCGCYNLSEFKKVEYKHIHCLDCYKSVVNAKRRQQRKQKKDLCKCCGKKHGKDECEGVNCGACNDHDYFPLTLLDGVMRCSFCVDDYNNGVECDCCGICDKSVGLATGENGVELSVCGFCDVDGSNYNGWGDKKEEESDDEDSDDESVCVCKGCGENIDDEGFCTEGCRFGEFAGVWTCDCGKECEDVEFCPDCPRDKEEEDSDKCCPCHNEFAEKGCICTCHDDYESADCAVCCENFLLDKLEIIDDKFYCGLCVVDNNENPNVYPYKKCSECGERKSCGCYQGDDWFCEDCAEQECSDENRCEDCTRCARTKPCSCGCGYLGGSCDKGLAIDNNKCTNCRDSTCDEAYKFSRGAEVMVLCDGCGGDWYNGIWERDGWNRV